MLLLLNVCSAFAEGEWEPNGNKEGVELFRKEVPGSDVIAVRGRGEIEAPLWKLAAILLDTARAPEWVDSLESSRVVRHLGPDTYIEFNHLRTPFVMKDRDFVSHVTIEADPGTNRFALRYRPLEAPEVPTESRIRGEILSGAFQLSSLASDPNKTFLDAEIHCDPRGSVAKWIVNFFQKDWAYDTFQALRRQAKKPDIKVPIAFREVFAPLIRVAE